MGDVALKEIKHRSMPVKVMQVSVRKEKVLCLTAVHTDIYVFITRKINVLQRALSNASVCVSLLWPLRIWGQHGPLRPHHNTPWKK